MSDSKIIIKIYSDTEDVSSISSAVKQLELKDFSVDCLIQKKIEINPDDILVFQISSLSSKYLNRILKVRENISNILIFVINTNDAVLVSSLAKLGFVDIFVLPFELPKLNSYLTEIITNKTYKTNKSESARSKKDIYNIRSIVGTSREFLRVLELAKKVADKNDVSVVILGETGTGKGLFARVIHEYSKRASGPFVDITCSAIPENLMESELFGYEAGAFTNAKSRKYGLFELAENGTLFLDEMGDLSLNIQAKLLRTIEKKLVRRLGGIVDIPINGRIISATNRDLEKMLSTGQFRRDLYHRLNVVSIEIPPLRERGDDVILITHKFIEDFNQQFNKKIKKIENQLKDFMMHYPWPGNIRELRNSVERAVLLSEDTTLRMKYFSNLTQNVKALAKENMVDLSRLPQFVKFELDYTKVDLKNLEILYAQNVFKKLNGNKSQTAECLGISRPKLDLLLKKVPHNNTKS
ncbi:MAG TPA: sigma-54 dependent transcriptional regulator [Ignavibacteriaceae bacterium]|nr:sigma-54 dependent transcriptional regulator [Ignavibacteriaceae bacterium]